MEKEIREICTELNDGKIAVVQATEKLLNLFNVSNRFPETTDKHEPLIIEMYKEHLVELYDFAYEQALKTGKVDELKEIDHKINGC